MTTLQDAPQDDTATANAEQEGTFYVSLSVEEKIRKTWAAGPQMFTLGTGARSSTRYFSVASEDLVASILETLDVLQNEQELQAFQEGARAIERGDTLTWEQMKVEFGW
jgi:hypothetical protein